MKKKVSIVQKNEDAIKALKGYLEYLNFTDPGRCNQLVNETFVKLGTVISECESLNNSSQDLSEVEEHD